MGRVSVAVEDEQRVLDIQDEMNIQHSARHYANIIRCGWSGDRPGGCVGMSAG